MLLQSQTLLEDIKTFSANELVDLASEIRRRIIEVVSENGGHLASNLGVVELTLALHKVFRSPEDKLIWDVGHQAYTHKILTGRNELFSTLWKYQGFCGFTHPGESEHDHFHAGHAGTALSLALGSAKTRDLNGKSNYVIPIIGDATLTCGMSLEALNNISKSLKRFIIVLNDNEMSISKNVGAITRILSQILSNPTTNKLYQEIDSFVSKIPAYGKLLAKQGHKITSSLKNLVSPSAFFEQYGVSYIGPIDGHDIQKLVNVFEGVKESAWPVIIHVQTKKGQGMNVAIENPVSYHGAKPFCKVTGKFVPQASKPTFPKIFGNHLVKMGEKDSNLVVVTPAMSAGSCLDPFMEKFPDRCFDVGIAESHAITFCGGLASDRKKKVIASIYATFLQRAFDNLFHDVCLQELPVVFCLDRAGLAPPYGSTHHAIYDLSFLNAMPNMIIAQPRNGQILKELIESAFSWNRPVAIRYPNLATEDFAGPLQYRDVGVGEVLKKGEELLILGLGTMCDTALEVRERLKKYSIMATVVDPVFIKPLDSELLCDLLMTHRYVVTLEEHSVVSGFGSMLNHFLLSQGFNHVQVLNFGVPETFVAHGSYQELLNEIGLEPKGITEKIIHHFAFNLSSLVT